jgi:transcriptional regulator with XRE-family HTH domain
VILLDIGTRIKKLRKNKGMFQRELADKAGVSRVAIVNYERSERIPNVDILSRIAIALGVTVNDLIADDKDMKELLVKKSAHSVSHLYPHYDNENSWIIENLDPKQKEEYIKSSQKYLESKNDTRVTEKQLFLLSEFVRTIALDFIELEKDNIENFSMSVASWLREYVEMATRSKIKEIIEKNIEKSDK